MTLGHPVQVAKEKWKKTNRGSDYIAYYNLLVEYVKQ